MRNLLLKFTPDRLVRIGLIIIILAIYGQTMQFDFVSYDDVGFAVGNADVDNFNVQQMFSQWAVFDFIPISLMSFAIEKKLFGPSAMHFHFFNMLLHIFNSLLAFSLLLEIFKKKFGGKAFALAGLTALLFATHPLNSETVSWVSARKDLLSTFFALISFRTYRNYLATNKGDRSKKYFIYIFSIFAFLLAMLSKSSVATLPLLLFIFDYEFKRNFSIKSIADKLPYLIVVLGIFSQNPIRYRLNEVPSMATAFHNLIFNFSFYVTKAIVPLSLAGFYDSKVFAPNSNHLIASVVILAILLLLSKTKEARWYVLFGVAFFFIALLPSLQLLAFQPKFFVADRYFYFGGIGFLCSLTLAISLRFSKTIAVSLLTILALLFSLQSFMRAKTWENGLTLWQDVTREFPNSPFAHGNLAVDYYNSGNKQLAADELNKALENDPCYTMALINSADVLKIEGQPEKALPLFQKAVRCAPQDTYVHLRLARYYFESNKWVEAYEEFKTAISLEPMNYRLYESAAVTALKINKIQEAEELVKKAISLNSNADISKQILEQIQSGAIK